MTTDLLQTLKNDNLELLHIQERVRALATACEVEETIIDRMDNPTDAQTGHSANCALARPQLFKAAEGLKGPIDAMLEAVRILHTGVEAKEAL